MAVIILFSIYPDINARIYGGSIIGFVAFSECETKTKTLYTCTSIVHQPSIVHHGI